MSSKRSEKPSWTRSPSPWPWNPLRKRVALPSVDGANQLQSSTSVSNSPSHSVVTLSDSIQARPTPPSTPAGSSTTLPTSAHPIKENAQVALNGLHELLKVLKESTEGFPPLKATLGGLVSCIEIYKRTSANHKEMDGLMNNINRLSSILARGLLSSQASLTCQGIYDLANTLENELEKIQVMHQRGFLARLAQNSDDAGELISSYRAIKDALDTFQVELTLVVERNTGEILKNVVFQNLPRSRDAAFNAAINLDNLSRGPCTKDTRVDIIKQIMDWAKETDVNTPPVYWLNGLAGMGKTTIAFTICQLLQNANLPFTSFFCSRQLDSKDSRRLVTTLCRDLAERFRSYACELQPVLERDSKVVDAVLSSQIDELLARPWQASLNRRDGLRAPVIVVDALDESDRGTEFLKELLGIVERGALIGIKFLITSRPDPKIVDLCKSFPADTVCKLHEVNTADVQQDIVKFLEEKLPKLKGTQELADLSRRSGGLFIYAATAVRFLRPPHTLLSASEELSELRELLESWPTSSDSGERLLVDELYEQILGSAFRHARIYRQRLQILHSALCTEDRITVPILSDLTMTDLGTVEKVVDSLHAVLFVSSKDNCVYWYHSSFPDFVFSPARAKFNLSLPSNSVAQEINVFCNQATCHALLARRCFSVMEKSLHFNMCDLESSYIFDSDVPMLNDRVQRNIGPTLRYSSRNWARHLLRAAPAERDTDVLFCGLNDFLCRRLLFWIEAMNLIGAKSECHSLLQFAGDWLTKGDWPDLMEYVTDAANFSAYFSGSAAAKSTPHLYISALSTWYQASRISKDWTRRFACIPSIILPEGAITVPLLSIPLKSGVKSVAFSPDGSQIVSGSEDHSVRVWDVNTGEQLKELKGHGNMVNSVAFSPDGDRIISGSSDTSVRVWDAKTGEQLRELKGHTGEVESVTLSPDGDRIVSGSCDKSVRVWDVKTGERARELKGHTSKVHSVASSPDGNKIVSGSSDNSVRVWDAKTGEQLRVLKGHTRTVCSVTFSPEGDRIISGSSDRSVRVWDAKTGKQLRVLKGHTSMVCSVAFSPDGDRIISGSSDHSVQLWDAATGEQLGELMGHTYTVFSLTFSPDGDRIISGSLDHSVRVWDAKMGEQLRVLKGHARTICSVAFSPDGDRIISGSSDHSVRVWDAKTGEQLRVLKGHTHTVCSVAFLPDGDRIISGSWDHSVRVWDTTTGEQLRELKGHTSIVYSVASSPDGDQIISGSDDCSVRVWDVKTGEQLRELKGHTDVVRSVAFSPEGDRIISGSQDKSVWVWDARTGEQLRELKGHTSIVYSVASSPDGDQIISGSDDCSVRVWDAKTGEQLRELKGHTSMVKSVAFSPEGDRIISGSWDMSVWMWDAKTGKQLRELKGHTSAVESVAFSPDGKQIVSGSRDHSVRVWDAKMGEQLRDPESHTYMMDSVAFSPDSDRIVPSSSDNAIQMWDHSSRNDLWVMHEDGWILSRLDRLIWVPSTLREVLYHPHTILIISRSGSARVSFEGSKMGTSWHECYTPL